jgi:hypothetical protein
MGSSIRVSTKRTSVLGSARTGSVSSSPDDLAVGDPLDEVLVTLVGRKHPHGRELLVGSFQRDPVFPERMTLSGECR